jgi:hypothetical protein
MVHGSEMIYLACMNLGSPRSADAQGSLNPPILGDFDSEPPKVGGQGGVNSHTSLLSNSLCPSSIVSIEASDKFLEAHRKSLMKISVSISDDLVAYLDAQVDDRSQLIEELLQQWRKNKQNQEMIQACLLSDEYMAEEWQMWETAEITDY